MNPARGRPPATRGVYGIEDPELVLPNAVGLDTSFLVRALIETEPLHASCRGLLDRLISSEITIVTSELLQVELAEAAFGIALKERWGRRWRQYRTDGRSRRRARGLTLDVLARYQALLSSVAHVSIPLSLVARAASRLMVDYGLASYDAVHAASAVAADAEAIVTTDTGFALLPADLLLVYTDRSRLAACRAKRPHRAARA